MVWVVLMCPACGQKIKVWPGTEATCIGQRNNHKRQVMTPAYEEIKA